MICFYKPPVFMYVFYVSRTFSAMSNPFTSHDLQSQPEFGDEKQPLFFFLFFLLDLLGGSTLINTAQIVKHKSPILLPDPYLCNFLLLLFSGIGILSHYLGITGADLTVDLEAFISKHINSKLN